jgi:4-amino-4-deoxy-L-arabinose transferase-like glycosyltransferase
MEWVIFVVAALVIILLVLAIIFRDKNHKTDYHAFFVMGLIWVGAGIPLMVTTNSPALFVMGVVFMVLGASRHKEWKKNIKDRHAQLKNMSKKEKKKHKIVRWIMFIALLLGLIALGIFYLFAA